MNVLTILPILLFAGVAAGVAWPFLAGKRGLLKPKSDALGPTPAVAGATTVGRPATSAGHREQLCSQCGKVNGPGRRLCVDCNGELPFEDVRQGFSALWQGKDRDELIREGVQLGALALVTLIAVMLSGFLSPAGKLLVMIGVLALLLWRSWNRITDD